MNKPQYRGSAFAPKFTYDLQIARGEILRRYLQWRLKSMGFSSEETKTEKSIVTNLKKGRINVRFHIAEGCLYYATASVYSPGVICEDVSALMSSKKSANHVIEWVENAIHAMEGINDQL